MTEQTTLVTTDIPGLMRLDEVQPPSPAAWNALETKSGIGAHHAVTRLADAVEEMPSAKECCRLADIIGRAQVAERDSDLDELIAEAQRTVRSEQ